MNPRAAAVSLLFFFVVLGSHRALAQSTLDAVPPPAGTAENEDWYIAGQPVAIGGAVYHPSGPITHFIRNEMVASGMFGRVPIYRRTTQEPGSVIYVPLTGGLVRPYERRRAGDLAGTVGSTAPAFRVVLPAEQALVSTSGPPTTAPAVPAAVGTSGFVYSALDRALGVSPATAEGAAAPRAATVPTPVGTGGPERAAPVLSSELGRRGPTRVETAHRPLGLNAVYVEFRETRWFGAGPAVEFAVDRFRQVGEHRGFPVYQQEGTPDLIFVSHVAGDPALVVPYRSR